MYYKKKLCNLILRTTQTDWNYSSKCCCKNTQTNCQNTWNTFKSSTSEKIPYILKKRRLDPAEILHIILEPVICQNSYCIKIKLSEFLTSWWCHSLSLFTAGSHTHNRIRKYCTCKQQNHSLVHLFPKM